MSRIYYEEIRSVNENFRTSILQWSILKLPTCEPDIEKRKGIFVKRGTKDDG